MALINCPECGARISDKADVCPRCGIPNDKMKSNSTKGNVEADDLDLVYSILENTPEFCPRCGKRIEIGEKRCKKCGLLTHDGIYEISDKLAPEDTIYILNPDGRKCPKCGRLCDMNEQKATCSICGYDMEEIANQKWDCFIYTNLKDFDSLCLYWRYIIEKEKESNLMKAARECCNAIAMFARLVNTKHVCGIALKRACMYEISDAEASDMGKALEALEAGVITEDKFNAMYDSTEYYRNMQKNMILLCKIQELIFNILKNKSHPESEIEESMVEVVLGGIQEFQENICTLVIDMHERILGLVN